MSRRGTLEHDRKDAIVQYLNAKYRDRETAYVPTHGPNLFAQDPLLRHGWFTRVLRRIGIRRTT